MNQKPTVSPSDLAHQINSHAESLRAAGVSFLPKKTAFALPVVAAPEPKVEASASFDLYGEEPAPAVLNVEQRSREMEALRQRVAACQRCLQLASTRTQTVFGVGPLDAELCFIGEAPGADEDAQGEPFVGAAGQLLNRIIIACGMKREEVYICNVLRCRPPNNRTPNAEEASNCREYLERQIELVEPRFICCLGGSASQSLLGTTASLGSLRRRFHQYKGIPVMCTYHPSYLLPHRSPEKKKDVWEDMKMLMAKMGRTIPTR